jgi:hypothetical protein
VVLSYMLCVPNFDNVKHPKKISSVFGWHVIEWNFSFIKEYDFIFFEIPCLFFFSPRDTSSSSVTRKNELKIKLSMFYVH